MAIQCLISIFYGGCICILYAMEIELSVIYYRFCIAKYVACVGANRVVRVGSCRAANSAMIVFTMAR
jgi:hypothetical protein